jgi:hypothetical protein
MTRASRILAACALGGTATLAACRSNTRAASDSATNVAREPGSLEGARKDTTRPMAAMPGMPGAAASGMMDSMETHMRAMTAASASQLKGLVPEHRQAVGNMIAQMNKEMRSMNMQADAAWTATMDSVRQDLVHLPDMTGSDLTAMMPAHHARITRLLTMHRDMMGKAKS